VLSKFYLRTHGRWQFGCAYARDLFHQHAREEIDHRSVAFDLWLHRGGGSVPVRLAAITSILVVGAVYLGMATPWILHRKHGGRFAATLAKLVARRQPPSGAGSTLKDLFRYVRRDYHPQRLIDETSTEGKRQ
jgi:predicted metal-dependent hydrolase